MFPELQTERFLLQQILPKDQSFIFQGLSHPDVIAFYGVCYTSFEETRGQMDFYERIWNERTGCYWKVVDRQSLQPVGVCGMNAYQPANEKAEIGYWLLPQYWKQGIMLEALPVMIQHLFKHWKLHRLESVVEAGNTASSKLALRLGFNFEGVLRESERKNGVWINLEMYSLLAADHAKEHIND